MSDEAFIPEHYPSDWSEFIGQTLAKRVLMVAAKSAKARGEVMSHVMISSPVPGIGKTSLALLVAKTLGTNLTIQAGPVKPKDLQYLFMDMSEGDVLFLDEIHRQGGKGSEWLLTLLQDGTVSTPLGQVEVPKITVIGATTDRGKLPQPVLDRFKINPTLEPYDDEDGVKIAMQLSRKILERDGLKLPTDAVATAIALAGNNSPRHMERVLAALRDLVWAEEIEENDGDYDVTEALRFAGVTADGLPSQAQLYLTTLLKDFHGNPAGERTMASRLGEVGSGLKELERLLLNKGLIGLTGQGRMLTTEGMRRARQLVAS